MINGSVKEVSRVQDRSFRLAVLLSVGKCPQWMWQSIESAATSGDIEVAFVAQLGTAPKRSQPWILDLYENWERRRFLPAGNLLDDIAVPVKPTGRALSYFSVEPDRLSALCKEYDVNVMLLSPAADRVLAPNTLSVPCWRIQFGDGDPRKQLLPGLWEVVERTPTFISIIETKPGDRTPHVLESVLIKTDIRSWMRSQAGIALKASELLRRWLPPKPDRRSRCADDTLTVIPDELKPADNLETARAVGRQLARFLRHAVMSRLTFDQWQIVIDESTDGLQLVDPQVLRPPRDRFWADPFPIQRNGGIWVFLEECLYSEPNRGYISVICRESSGAWSTPKKVLDRDYHVSYPFVFNYSSDLFMLPETTSARRIELYRCVEFPTKWELCKILVENFLGAEPTLFEQDGTWWLFVEVSADLHLFYAASPLGPFAPHKSNPVKSDYRNTRPAGRIFALGDTLIRPTQDCSIQYGRAVVFNKIMHLDRESFKEVEIARLHHPWPEAIGCHTFNRVGKLTIVDRLVRMRRW